MLCSLRNTGRGGPFFYVPVFFLFFSFAAPAFGQNAAGVPLAVEIQNIENSLARTGISPLERQASLMRLAQLRRLSGDIEKAAANWLEAARLQQNAAGEEALLSGVYCLIALGEWERALAAIRPVEGIPANFLQSCIKAWTGDTAPLRALADNPAYLEYKSRIYFILWKMEQNGEVWKNRLLSEFPLGPEGLIASQSQNINARVSPLWLLFPEPASSTARAQTPTAPATTPPAASSSSAQNSAPAQSSAPAANSAAQTTSAQASAPSAVSSPANIQAVNLQTGLFSQYANAVNLMERLKSAGFSPFLEQRTQGGNTFWAVLVPSGPDVNASIRALRTAGFESFPLR